MKKLLSFIVLSAIVLSMFSVSFAANAESIKVTFNSNNASASSDIFKEESVSAGGSVSSSYEIPDVGGRFIFKGWYYGREDNAQPVNFDTDTFEENTDIYAHWADIGVVTPDASDDDKNSIGAYDGFDLTGVQLRAGEITDETNGGIRFVGSLSNSLLEELDAISDMTIVSGDGYTDRVEYGVIAAKREYVDNWVAVVSSKVTPFDYDLGYNGTNVNGVDTTLKNRNNQGFVVNVDCTASDYSSSSIKDFQKYNEYRLYSFAITYGADNVDQSGVELIARAYLRYYDANGLLRTVYDDYDGTDSYGGLSTSYDSVESYAPEIGYYSSLSAAVNDANNLTVANGTADSSSAACSMYISGEKAYIKLLKNTALSASASFTKNAELNLGGYTLSTGSFRINSNADFNMYNGTYSVGSTIDAFGVYSGGVTRITNVDFKAENLSLTNQFNGIFCRGESAYISDCGFDIAAQTSDNSCYADVFFNTKQAVVSGCTYSISSGSKLMSMVYSYGSDLKVQNCDGTLAQTSENTDAKVYGVQAWDSDNAAVKDTAVRISGDYGTVSAALARNNDENDETSRFLDVENLTLDIDVDDIYSTDLNASSRSLILGLGIGQGEEAVVKNTDIDIDTKAPNYAYVYGMLNEGNAQVKTDDINIDISASEKVTISGHTSVKAYAIEGIVLSGTAENTILRANVKVPIGYNGSADYNFGIRATDNSIVTVNPANNNDVYVQGGNAALSSSADAEFYISGGNFCSQSHGGGYLNGDTEITGGNYYVVNEGEYVPSEGGLYITNNAVVNISGATITGGTNGIRTKSNDGRADNPTVTISDTDIKGGAWGVHSGAGTITLNQNVTIKADNPKFESGGTIIDNRNN